MKRIPLYRADGSVRAYARVDDADYTPLSEERWNAMKGGRTMYARRGRGILMHVEIMGGSADRIDHIDGDGLNNQRSNLRLATRAENQHNRTRLNANNRSGFRGVSWDRGKWRAVVFVHGRRVHLGRFDSPEIADRVASAFRAEHMPFSADARR